jgi:hypothetical protein
MGCRATASRSDRLLPSLALSGGDASFRSPPNLLPGYPEPWPCRSMRLRPLPSIGSARRRAYSSRVMVVGVEAVGLRLRQFVASDP